MAKQKNKNRDLFFILVFIFRLILDVSYIKLSGEIEYSVEFVLAPNFFKFLLSYILLFLVTVVSYKKYNTIVIYFYRIIIFFVIAPLTCVYACRDGNSTFILLTTISFAIAEYFSITHWTSEINYLEEGSSVFNKAQVSTMFGVFCFFVIFLTLVLMYQSNGIPQLTSVIFENVYEIRNSYNTSSYLSYLLYVTTQVIIPFSIALSIVRKKYILTVGCLLTQLCFFLWTGHKTWLFSILLILFMLITIKTKKPLNTLFVSVVFLTGLACLFHETVLGYTVFTLINRRVLLDPAALKFFYYQYFIVDGHPSVGVSGTLLAPIFGSANENDLDYAYTISAQYTDVASNAGTGLYGGDIANLGILTLIIVPICLVFLASIINLVNKSTSSVFALLLFTYLTFSFNDQRIFAYLLDFRGIVLITLVYFINKQRKQHYYRPNNTRHE